MSSPVSNLARKVDARLAACAALATAAVAIPATAQATIVYTDLSANPVALQNNTNGVYLNFITGVTGTSGAALVGWDFNPYGTTTGGLSFFSNANGANADNEYVGTGTIVLRLSLGQDISAASGYTTGTVQSGANLFRTSTGIGYVGVMFFNEVDSAIHYGWVALNTTAGTGGTAGFPGSIVGYAYESVAGAAIAAGATGIPEPTTLALLGMAAGALGVREWRRRRAA